MMKYLLLFILLLTNAGHAYCQSIDTKDTTICNHPLRKSFEKLPEIKITSNWYKVYQVGKGVIAIVEPYNFEEVISYLIVGNTKALLFDTGMGVESIAEIVKQLTKLPVMVINSHTHYDHIGGNYEFENVLALKTSFTLQHATNGWDHESVKHEVTNEAICLDKLTGLDTAKYSIHPFTISKYVSDGDEIDLGARKIKVMTVPGHTPDAIALLDKKNNYLWTGDSYYDGAIYLFAEGTDLLSYQNSVAKLATIAPQLKKVFPSHNNPIASPQKLIELQKNFSVIKSKNAKYILQPDNTLLFEFKNFGFKVNKELLEAFRETHQ